MTSLHYYKLVAVKQDVTCFI